MMMAVSSDPAVIEDVRAFGEFDANACLQCGSCTVVCEVSANSAAFPRRPIRYVLLGLRDLVRSCVEPWLCHACGDCSDACPRETKPATAMETLRRYLVAQYDWTGLAARLDRSRRARITAHLSVSLFVLLLIVFYHLYFEEMTPGEFISMAMGMEHMFSLITYFTITVILLPFLLLLSQAVRMIRFVTGGLRENKIPLRVYTIELKTYIAQSVAHNKLLICPQKYRWVKHWLLALGCMTMFVILLFALSWFQTDNIYPLYHPQRWVGYLATVFILLGAGGFLFDRLRARETIYQLSDAHDLTLLVMLLLTAVSGIAVHVFRYLEIGLAAHFSYAVHIMIVTPMLLIEIPFGKWAHVIFRPLAIYLQSVQEKAGRVQRPGEEVATHVPEELTES